MTRTVEQLWMEDFLALVGVPRPTLHRVLARNHGDKASALCEVLAAVVHDPNKPLHSRRMSALKLVALEPDPQRRWAWQQAAYEFELTELAARHLHEADLASANYRCAGCRKLSGTVVDVDHREWLTRLPPPACQRLEKGKPCCLFFSARSWKSTARPFSAAPGSAQPHDTVDVGDRFRPVTHDHDAETG